MESHSVSNGQAVPRLSNDDQLRIFGLVKQGMSIEDALQTAEKVSEQQVLNHENGVYVRDAQEAGAPEAKTDLEVESIYGSVVTIDNVIDKVSQVTTKTTQKSIKRATRSSRGLLDEGTDSMTDSFWFEI